MKRKVGCILTKNHYIISTGYNGTPRNIANCYEGGCQRCNSNASMGTQLDLCLCLHAEENALLEAGRDKANGATLYCNTCPCIGCTTKISKFLFYTNFHININNLFLNIIKTS